jgi:hypothetical protein
MKNTAADNRISIICNWNVEPSIEAQCCHNLEQDHYDFIVERDNYW